MAKTLIFRRSFKVPFVFKKREDHLSAVFEAGTRAAEILMAIERKRPDLVLGRPEVISEHLPYTGKEKKNRDQRYTHVLCIKLMFKGHRMSIVPRAA